MKHYFLIAASALALASCSSDDFLGGNAGNETEASNLAINFNGATGKITRAANNAPELLNHQFIIYGVKKGTEADKYLDVFKNYKLWDATTASASCTNGWEYVGEAGTHGQISLTSPQYIKYWDYSSADYRFVAGSPVSNFSFETDANGSVSATITGLGGHITANTEGNANTYATVYVASPVVVAKTNYQKPVEFSFVRQQSKVRVGIYETIPGYSITEIKFYKQGDDELTADGTNLVLTNATADYFVGGTNATGKITYSWGETPGYTYAYEDAVLTKARNWYAGAFANGVKATSSTADVADLYGTDQDMDAQTGYFSVLPTPSATEANAILIKCDYTLTSLDGSKETINVKGATAAIPAAFSKWEPNTQYTYIFKITQNTNGTTGDPTQNDPAGLFPISFAAAVAESTNAEIGTVTSVTAPSITTYQPGSVADNTVAYKTGEDIYITAAEIVKGELLDLKSGDEVNALKVYKLTKEYSEAELQTKAVADEELKADHLFSGLTIATADKTIGSATLPAGKYATFNPTDEGFYAIQCKIGDNAYTYKIVSVKSATQGGINP